MGTRRCYGLVFSETPELYDRIYGSFKDYAAEARRVAELLAERAPEAVTVLDVACGTGEHARFLRAEHGYRVDGLDIEPSFVELARAKVGEGRFWEADMADFHLDARYDVVICLFSSIGYLESLSTTGELTEALERAGFSSVEHDPEGLTGRGLLVARA